jgi:geranylgeranyl diphosphate synthase type II
MLDYKSCQLLIEEKLSEIEYSFSPAELYEPVKYILSLGGKRLRPCLALMAHNLFSDNLEQIINPSVGIEIFHNFTLMHDDIMDNAPLRRNHKTVHFKWNNNIAILSGDAMMIIAYDYISRINNELLPKVLSIFNRTALQVCEGQQFDMNFENSSKISESEYLKMIQLKTAVLIGASLAIGATTANALSEDIDRIYNFGLNIGTAFQIQDDYLDVYADQNRFGKSIGGDILANKKTYLLVSALNSGERGMVKKLEELMKLTNIEPKNKIRAVTDLYNNLNVKENTKKIIDTYFKIGIDYLNQVSVDGELKQGLYELVTQIIKREH